jgi:RNA-dependent RNA polymerase
MPIQIHIFCHRQGSLADRHIVIADQSVVRPCETVTKSLSSDSQQDGIFDERCTTLARLYRIAIDYPTNGLPVIMDNEVPNTSIKAKPDWHCLEVPNSRHVDYYKSGCALGHLFRGIDVHEVLDGILIASPGETDPLGDVISRTLAPLVQSVLDTILGGIQIRNVRTEDLYARYASEMRFICATHSVSTLSDPWLSEEEVVLGTILAKCSQPCWREDRSCRMRMHAETLVNHLRVQIVGVHSPLTVEELSDGLRNAWAMWSWAQHHREESFIQSFSLVTLGLVLELLELFGALPDS